MSLHRSIVALLAAATLSACAAPDAVTGEASQAATVSGDDALRLSRAFISRNGDSSGRLCRAAGRGTRCVSGDGREPVAAIHTSVDDLVLDCDRTPDGRLTSCAPVVKPFQCMGSDCRCFSYADCWDLAIERRCNVTIFDGHLGPITGACTAGDAD